jgi:hypothetical protein
MDFRGVQYRLQGIVEHEGATLDSGHYVTYVLKDYLKPEPLSPPPRTEEAVGNKRTRR